jgi:hypothetical protein
MPETRFTPEEASRLAALAPAPLPLGPAAEAGRLQALRAEHAGRYFARARAALDLPTFVLPLLPRPTWDRAAVEEIAAAIDAAPPGGTPWPT